MALLVSVGGVFCGPGLGIDSSIQTKSGVHKLSRVLCEEVIEESADRQGRLLIARTFGEVMLETYIYFRICGLLSRA